MLAGFSKLAGPSGTDWAVRLSHWGYPAASRYAIGGIEILAGLGLLFAAAQTIGCGFPGGGDGRSPAQSPPTRRIGPSITAADFRRIVVCTLLVAASCLPESGVNP